MEKLLEQVGKVLLEGFFGAVVLLLLMIKIIPPARKILNLFLQLLGYEITSVGNVEFICKEFRYYPSLTKPFIVGRVVINNKSVSLNTITDIVLNFTGNGYTLTCPVSLICPFGEFISTPFSVSARGSGYYKKCLYFEITPSSPQPPSEFADNQGIIRSVPLRLIIKTATSKKIIFLILLLI
ncbi:MAG: hypothetical protein V1709_06625 [Planctomycetota bacterium]